MPYSRNFGFRGFQNLVRNGRHKTPATGNTTVANTLALGAPVTIGTNGEIALAGNAASPAPTPGALSGVLVYEHIQFQGVDPNLTTYVDAPFDIAPLGRYAQVVQGKGVKVWLKNTSDVTLYDGRVRVGRTMVKTLSGLAVGDGLCPNETGDRANGLWRKAVAGTDAFWLTVESVNTTANIIEARVNF